MSAMNIDQLFDVKVNQFFIAYVMYIIPFLIFKSHRVKVQFLIRVSRAKWSSSQAVPKALVA